MVGSQLLLAAVGIAVASLTKIYGLCVTDLWQILSCENIKAITALKKIYVYLLSVVFTLIQFYH